jgi:hypothetical protein
MRLTVFECSPDLIIHTNCESFESGCSGSLLKVHSRLWFKIPNLDVSSFIYEVPAVASICSRLGNLKEDCQTAFFRPCGSPYPIFCPLEGHARGDKKL